MPDSAWTAFVGTILGGLIAGGSGWLNSRLSSGRERVHVDRSLRRQAYIEFAYQVESQEALLDIVCLEITSGLAENRKSPLQRLSDLHDGYAGFKKAYVAIQLSASPVVKDATESIDESLVRLQLLAGKYLMTPPSAAHLRGATKELQALVAAHHLVVEPLITTLRKDLGLEGLELQRPTKGLN